MRPIEFRVWDEEVEEFFYSDQKEDDYFFEFDNGILKGFAIRFPKFSSDILEPPEPYTDDYPVEQFTGLYDSTKWEQLLNEEQEQWVRSGNKPSDWKGRKIFEGDVDNHGSEVVYDSDCACFALHKEHWPVHKFFYELSEEEKDNLEIIGNIHQNPELLK